MGFDPVGALAQALLVLLLWLVGFVGFAYVGILALLGEVKREERREVWIGTLRWCLMTLVLFETWWWLR